MIDLEVLQSRLAEGAVALTPNRRLALRLRRDLARALPPETAALTPSIYVLGDWLERLWRGELMRLSEPQLVLSPMQEQQLWLQIVEQHAIGMSWLRPGMAARQAATAYRQLVLWQVDLHCPAVRAEMTADPDSAALLAWCDHFREQLAARNWLAAVDRDALLLERAQTGQLVLESPLITLALVDPPPLHRQLLEQASSWHPQALSATVGEARVVTAADEDEEIRLACRWLRAQRESGAGEEPRLALVVPDLARRRVRIQRLLAEEWDPTPLVGGSQRQPSVDLTAGTPLAETPLVRSALRLLQLWRGELALADVLALAQCPFSGLQFGTAWGVGWLEEVAALEQDPVTVGQLRRAADRVAERHPEGRQAALCLQRTAELERRWRIAQARTGTARWREWVEALLGVWRWPVRSLDSIEYQQHQHWQQALNQFAALDAVTGPLNLQAALSALQRLLQEHVFQPRVEPGGLQVMGLLETAGQRFDRAWVCGMGARQWPAAAQPHPLLPRSLQRRLRMPHCDAARELHFSQQISRDLLSLAPVVRFSYPRELDGAGQGVSPLLTALPAEQPEALPAGLLDAWIARQDLRLEQLEPGRAPRVGDAEQPRGGSRLLQNQSLCPFRAFAEHRLGARALPEPCLGPTHLDRGQLVHEALERFWQPLEGQRALAGLGEAQRRQRVSQAASEAVAAWLPRRGWLPRQQLAELERQRLEQLLGQWLEEVELARPAFEVVALEQARSLSLGPLNLQLRADRIDDLGGRLLFIDYKSAAQLGETDWLGERPREPQLPLYAVAAEQERPGSVAGIAFGQLHAGSRRMMGLGEGPFRVSLSAEEWQEQKQSWQEVLTRLAEEFVAGLAEVDPVEPGRTCRHCEVAPICRHHHQAELDEAAIEPQDRPEKGATS